MPDNNGYFGRERYEQPAGAAESVGTYTAKTFLWMFLGLLVTFAVAVWGYSSMTTLYLLIRYPSSSIVLLVAELAVVILLSARIHKLSVGAARVLFFLYAILNGVVFSTYFLMFEMPSLILVFAATAVYFAALAAYGYLTKTDLARLRPILMGGLIFLLVFGVLSLFIPGMSSLDRIVSLVGIAIFLGCTAYDTQKIKACHAAFAGNPEMAQKASILSALELYLDFINLFLYLLRFMGKSKN